jgi:PAS domain S-box-containing protein
MVMTRPKLELQIAHSPVLRYGLAVLSVATALGAAFLLERYHFREAAFPLFLLANAITCWYAGVRPAILAVVFSSLAFNYFFTEPFYSFYVARSETAYYVAFILFAALIIWFSAVRRRVERQLLQSRYELEKEVTVRTQQASLLNLTHDTIFVRDMSDVITYWNRGAEELYGWTAEEAMGKDSRQLLRTVFPAPVDEILAELLRTDRWEGELKKTRADGTEVVVASRWSLRRDEHGRDVAILETNNDITERAGSEKFKVSIGNLQSVPRNSRPSIRNWKRLPILSRTTCVRPFAIWLAILRCFKRGCPPPWMKRATTTWR